MILAGLFLGFALSLSGVFLMGTGLIGAGERLTRSAGPTGSFFTGTLATLAATPCTAPYMGAAVGFALAAPAAVCILILLTMGLGFALPMVGLSASPALVRLLPGPGPWLETVKRVLALPLYATTAWLVWVLSLQAGSTGVLAAVVLKTFGDLYGHDSRVATALLGKPVRFEVPQEDPDLTVARRDAQRKRAIPSGSSDLAEAISGLFAN